MTGIGSFNKECRTIFLQGVQLPMTDPEPTIKVILQRLYDVVETPTICDRRVTLKVQILAPNQRPAQVTRDLKGFWENSYAGVRSELKGRYPKHEWR